MTAWPQLTVTETRLFLREPVTVLFVLFFPALLLVILGAIPSFREPLAEIGGLRVVDLYTQIVISMAMALLAFNVLPSLLAQYREKGILRRMRTTPVQPAAVLGAQLSMCLMMTVATLLILLAVSRLAFGVGLPQNPAAYGISYLLCAVALFAIGLLVAAVSPSGQAANGIGTLLFFPVLFFGGLWLPREQMNDTLRTISDLTPLGAGVQSLQDAAAGQWPQLLHLGVMAGWALLAGAVAARYFRWE